MKTKYFAYPMKHLIIMDASGKMDFPASKIALDELAANPEFDRQTEVLLDLRDADCNLTTVDLYDIAAYMAWPNPAVPTSKKIAILVEGRLEFDHAQFLVMCLRPRGIHIAAFDGYEEADAWLDAALPEDPKKAA